MDRNEKIAKALNVDIKLVKHWNLDIKRQIQHLIRACVRELWCKGREDPKHESRYIEFTYHEKGYFLALVREVCGVNGYEQHPAFLIDEERADTEAIAWEEALLWLSENKDG